MTQVAICTENLTRDFKTVRAIDALCLEVPVGAVFGFLGPNGAGKTTMIRLLLGLLEPTGGRAQVLGLDTVKQADQIRHKAGALLEHAGLYERLTAEDNLEFYARAWRMPKADRQARIKELLEHMNLWDRRKERLDTWSRGMKQKLTVARTLLHRPAIVFLDEPTAGFDPIAAAALREDLARLAQIESVTIFLTTHNLSEAEKLCSLVAVIKQGKLLTVGHPDELRRQSGTTRTEVLGRNFTDELIARLAERPEVACVAHQNGRLLIDLHEKGSIAPLVSFLVHQGVEIEEVRKDKASLEEAFLSLMEEDQ